MKSLVMDVIKINAYDHMLGIQAEYAWLAKFYPDAKRKVQGLAALDLNSKSNKHNADQIYFDALTIEMQDGRIKNIYFDISQFFPSNDFSSFIDPGKFAKKILADVYNA